MIDNTNDKFLDFMEQHRHIDISVGSKYYKQILRDFRNVYSSDNIQHLIHLHKSGVSMFNGQQHKIRLLIGYLYSRKVCSNDGVSIGRGLMMIGRDEKDLHNILKSDLNRLIVILKNLAGLLQSKDVKLNPYSVFKYLNAWETQKNHKNKDWVKKQIIKDFYNEELKSKEI